MRNVSKRFCLPLLLAGCTILPIQIGYVPLASADSEAPADGDGTHSADAAHVPASHRASFRRHLRKAEALYQATAFAQAIPEYQAAYEIHRDPNLLFKLGRAYHRDGNWSEALVYYEKYQREVPEPSPQLKRSLQEYIRQLRAALNGAESLQGQSGHTGESAASPAPRAGASPAGNGASALHAARPPAGPDQSPEKNLPFYKRPLFWSLVGAGVGTIAITSGIAGAATATRAPTFGKDVPIFTLSTSLFTF